MADLTADQILDQTALGNNLGLHLAANGSVRVHILDAMEYYNSFGGVPDDILEQIAQNNDLGLQLSAGWIRSHCIAAMENYADQGSNGLEFTIQLALDHGMPVMSFTNENEVGAEEYSISLLAPPSPSPIVIPYFRASGPLLPANSTIAVLPTIITLPTDSLYRIAFKCRVGGTRYVYTADNVFIEVGGDAVSFIALPNVVPPRP